MRNRLQRLERAAEGIYYINIPQQDGPPKRFSQSQVQEAFLTSVARLKGDTLEVVVRL